MSGLDEVFETYGIEYRYNIRAHRPEFYTDNPDNAANMETGDWIPSTDRITSHIRESIRRDFVMPHPRPKQKGETIPAVFGRDRWMECFSACLKRVEVDPFREWLEEVEKDKSHPFRHEKILDCWVEELFEVDKSSWRDPRQEELPIDDEIKFNNQQIDLLTWASRYLFLTAVWRTFQPGYKIDEILVLVGNQGLGKSAIGYSMLPEHLSNCHGDALVLSDDAKKFAEALQNKVIVEASEMSGLGRADLERLKANMTRRDDGSVRLAYRRDPEPLPRRCVMFGTSNESECLPNDSTGNRRFVVIKLNGSEASQSIESYMNDNRTQLWKEAIQLYRDGTRPNLPRDISPLQAEINEQHRRGDIIIEDEVSKLPAEQFATGATMAEITQAMIENPIDVERRLMQPGWAHRLGKALKLQNWTKKRARKNGISANFWFPPA